ncbi:MAG: hypothetical protein LBJ63_00430 [Prevotellaceae bacterium]|jgi:hypothetical protein|nr:hypothetical protein [Prevotellaceae bacterium]
MEDENQIKYLSSQINELHKEIILLRADKYVDKFLKYIDLISTTYILVDFWEGKRDIIKDYDSYVNENNNDKIKQTENENDFILLYKNYKYIYDFHNKYMFDGCLNFPSHLNNKQEISKINTEIDGLLISINFIWYGINCRKDIRESMSRITLTDLNNKDKYTSGRIKYCIKNFDAKYLKENDPIVELIADISGDVEIEIATPYLNLIHKYYE